MVLSVVCIVYVLNAAVTMPVRAIGPATDSVVCGLVVPIPTDVPEKFITSVPPILMCLTWEESTQRRIV